MKTKYIMPFIFLLAFYGCGGGSSEGDGNGEEETLAGTYDIISSNCELQVESVTLTTSDGLTYVSDDLDPAGPGSTYLSFTYGGGDCAAPQVVDPSGTADCSGCSVEGTTITFTNCTSNECSVTLTKR